MKAKIKALQGKMCRLDYKVNGYDHSICGKVKEVLRINFVFLVNGAMNVKIKIKNVTNIKEIV